MELAIIRVKRRIDASHSDALVVNLKKPRIDLASASSSQTESLTERAGFLKTVGDTDDTRKAASEFLQHSDDSKSEKRKPSAEFPDDAESASVKPKRIKLIDLNEDRKLSVVEDVPEAITCNDQAMDCAYVYDLYLWKTTVPVDDNLDNISAFPSEYRDLVPDANPDEAENYDGSSDSNSENNWRNEYPDDEDELVARKEDESFDESASSQSDKSDKSDNEEVPRDENETELQRIKRKYSKILKMMKHESCNINYDNIFK